MFKLFLIITFIINYVNVVLASVSCTGQNEIVGCKSTCPQTCDSIGKKYHCPLEPAHCQSVCRCKPNFFRNKIGECISTEDCLKCNGTHEYFSCRSACDNECATLKERNQTNCPIINKKCNPMCYCEAGYARDNKNICIPIEDCPRCKENEIESACVNSVCEYRNCSDVGQPINCVKLDSRKCIKGCICIDKYLRNEIGICIPEDQCPNAHKCPKQHEYYDLCPPECPQRICGIEDSETLCPQPLKVSPASMSV